MRCGRAEPAHADAGVAARGDLQIAYVIRRRAVLACRRIAARVCEPVGTEPRVQLAQRPHGRRQLPLHHTRVCYLWSVRRREVSFGPLSADMASPSLAGGNLTSSLPQSRA